MYSILIADDDYYQGVRYMNMEIWGKFGFEVAAAVQTERQAVDFLKKNGADLVLTEVNRPQLDGIRLAQEIKRLYSGTCVVFFSQRSDFESARKGMRLGVLDYILKPADERELSQMLSRVKARLDAEKGGALCEQAENVLKSIGKGSESRLIRTVSAYLCDNIYQFVTMRAAEIPVRCYMTEKGKHRSRYRKPISAVFCGMGLRIRIRQHEFLCKRGIIMGGR